MNELIELELGVGNWKHWPGTVGVDIRPTAAADLVGDAADILRGMAEASVRAIYSSHFVEHVDDLSDLLRQCARVLVDGGRFEAVAPHFSNAYYYSDPTHVHPFGLYTFAYFGVSNLFRRQVPRYETDIPLRLQDVKLEFQAETPFLLRNIVRRGLGSVVNLHRSCQEFYEDVLAGLFSCYQVRYLMERLPRP